MKEKKGQNKITEDLIVKVRQDSRTRKEKMIARKNVVYRSLLCIVKVKQDYGTGKEKRKGKN